MDDVGKEGAKGTQRWLVLSVAFSQREPSQEDAIGFTRLEPTRQRFDRPTDDDDVEGSSSQRDRRSKPKERTENPQEMRRDAGQEPFSRPIKKGTAAQGSQLASQPASQPASLTKKKESRKISDRLLGTYRKSDFCLLLCLFLRSLSLQSDGPTTQKETDGHC